MKKRHRPFFHKMEYLGALFFLGLFRLLPLRLTLQIANQAAPLLSRLFPIRKKVIRENLLTAFPDAPPPTIQSLIRETYRNFLLFVMEFVHFPGSALADLSKHITSIEGEEYFKELGGGRKPILFVTAHIGNWELMGAYFASKGIKISVLAKPIHNPYVDRFVNRIRMEKGLSVISTREMPLKQVLKAIKEGECVAFLADQDARRAGIFVEFFGKPASTFTGPALFSLRSGLPLLPAFILRTGLLTHKVVILPPIYPPETDRDSAIFEITEQYNRILEGMIRKYPGQYFWFHKRWKSQPS